ncbi:hypothetical protein Glove_258g53 [Diversispora epigaea]|uniref:Protein kinase domain-containing protein n=1 Tax=Diversispora epigaea TaxID=1348612 RepID=A0A397ICF6_9GLOM|nr:hypothetical protein Glove_258g53 [Diversispora epigaea]
MYLLILINNIKKECKRQTGERWEIGRRIDWILRSISNGDDRDEFGSRRSWKKMGTLRTAGRVYEVPSIPLAGIDRAIIAKLCVEKLQSHQKLFVKRFNNPGYREAFIGFNSVLNSILSFAKKVSDASLFQKIANTTSIKDQFGELINDFDRSLNMLHFSVTIDNSIQGDLDTENIDNDITELKTLLKNFGGADCKFIQEIQNHKIEKNRFRGIKTINPLELIQPNVGKPSDRRGGNGFLKRFIIKKVLKGSDVACISCYDEYDEDDEIKESGENEYTKRFQAELAILEKLKDSANILRFYGLSKFDGHRVMVFEWAEWGNLQEVYSNRKIDWNNKIHIALDICRGLVFLHLASILHHDIRCRNIMMTPRFEPKIANFIYSRENNQMTTGYEKTVKILHWMAPEKIRSTNERPVKYTYECEIFSFGMLLWELTFQKIPYNNLNIEEVKKTVLGGKRETFRFEKGSSELLKLQKKLRKIIENAWDDVPYVRNSSQTIFTKFVKLANYCDDLDKKDPNILNYNSSNSPSQPIPDIQDLEEKFVKITLPYIKPFSEGVKSHNAKDYKTAWEIFECHENLVPTAKYWKAYYYDHGYHVKQDLVKAANLYKELADDGFADASLRYSQMILKKEGGLQLDKSAFLMYLTKAADNGNLFAQFKLGDLLVKQGNKDIGVKYLRIAALSDNAKAIELLEKMKINFCDSLYTKNMSFSNNKDLNRIAEDQKIQESIELLKEMKTDAYEESDDRFADDDALYTKNMSFLNNKDLTRIAEDQKIQKSIELLKEMKTNAYEESDDRFADYDSFLARIEEDKNIKKFDYNKFEDIKQIATGAFGSVNRAYSKVLRKDVALKCLHDENSNNFYKAFMNELQNTNAVNHHENIIKYYGVSIDHSAEKCYLVLQYAKNGDLRTYLRNNFKDLDWKTKINMAQDITNGLCYMHEANIIHQDLHSKNILVHKGKLLITDLGLSKSVDANTSSFAGGMFAYSDPEYLRNQIKYKRSKASDIYSLGVLFWELSSGIPPFDNLPSLEIYKLVVSGEREAPVNGTPEDYIKIYSDAWKDNPKQRPTIENICDSLENIQFENIYNNFNKNNQYIQTEVYTNNQSSKFKPMESYSRDSISIESKNQISFRTSISLENLEIAVIGNSGEPLISGNF